MPTLLTQEPSASHPADRKIIHTKIAEMVAVEAAVVAVVAVVVAACEPSQEN
jgi:hypothetical protein